MNSKMPVTFGVLMASFLLSATAGAAIMHATYTIDATGVNVLHKMGSTMTSDHVTGTITLNTDTNKLCSALQQHGLGMVTSADVNLGAKGTDGPSVAMLNVAQINHKSMHPACVTVTHILANKILAHPSKYYVVVSNATHPHGAVRGQL